MGSVESEANGKDLPRGAKLWLNISRFDERQRRMRLRLPKPATCWDYAPLIDLVVHETGVAGYRFLGQTVADRVALLQRHNDPATAHFMAWFERAIAPHMAVLDRRRRVPDNHYCVDVALLPLVSSLPATVRELGPNRASAAQWSATLHALTEKGVKREELLLSGVLERLNQQPSDAKHTKAQVLRMMDLSHAMPKLVSESRFGFAARAGWRECCDRLPAREHKRRRLHGIGHGMAHVRYRHRSLGWAVARTRFSDLLVEQRDWWIVLDEAGRLVEATKGGFASPEDAIEFAELQIGRRFARWGKDQAAARWEHFSMPGGDGYRELLLQLDDWPQTYRPRHYGTRNVLVHVRTSIRWTTDGRRVLFLDEVQSDWHADLHAQAKRGATSTDEQRIAAAPYGKEWPLLTMKVMLWWAQRCGAEGLAWSSAELQQQRWHGYGPPDLLYRKMLPEAGLALAKALMLRLGTASLRIRDGGRVIERGSNGWEVCGRDGQKLTKAFADRGQAEAFADFTGDFIVLDMPVLWLDNIGSLASIPLFGTGGIDTRAAAERTPTTNTARQDGGSGGEPKSLATRRLAHRGRTASHHESPNFNVCPHHHA
jgi:hypothetical protein